MVRSELMIVPEAELIAPWGGRDWCVSALDPLQGRAGGRELFVYTVESLGPGAQAVGWSDQRSELL